MSKKENSPISYHIAFYPITEEPDWSKFKSLCDEMGASSKVPNYVTFSSNKSRLEIINDCEEALSDDFYYGLIFDRGEGDGFYLEAHPKAGLRARLALSKKDRGDMMECFDAVSMALETRAEIKLKAAKRKQ